MPSETGLSGDIGWNKTLSAFLPSTTALQRRKRADPLLPIRKVLSDHGLHGGRDTSHPCRSLVILHDRSTDYSAY